jgi:hypothetical protein
VNTDGTDLRQLTSNGLAPEHPTWSPNGQWIVFNDASFKPGAHETIWTMRANGAHRHVIYQGTSNTGGVKPHFSPDDTHILFCVRHVRERRRCWPHRRHLHDACRRKPRRRREQRRSGVREQPRLAAGTQLLTHAPNQVLRAMRQFFKEVVSEA